MMEGYQESDIQLIQVKGSKDPWDLLGLVQFRVGSWTWIVRSTPDLHLTNEEPFYTLLLMYEEHSRRYIFRVLGRTFQSGTYSSLEDLRNKCEALFSDKVGCLGFQEVKPHSFPISCSFSPDCLIVVTTNVSLANYETYRCSKCLEFLEKSANIASLMEVMEDIKEEKTEMIHFQEELGSPPPLSPKVELEEDTLPLALKQRRKRARIRMEDKKTSEAEALNPPWTCSLCQKVLKFKSRHNHLKFSHFMGDFKCDECGEKFEIAKELIKHNETSHPNITKCTCPSCHESLEFGPGADEDLAEHYESCIKVVAAQSRRIKRSSIGTDGHPFYQCDICGKRFKCSSIFSNHKRTHRPPSFGCQLCDYKAITKGNLRIHQRVHEQGQECVCPICGKMLKHKVSLALHVKSAHEEPPPKLPCEKCGQEFAGRSSLKKHIRRVHDETSSMVCPVCNKKTGGRHELEAHVKTHDDPTITCPTCGIKLKTPRSYKAHLRTHTGETPYKCHICEKTFKTSSPYYYHMTHVHNVKGKIKTFP